MFPVITLHVNGLEKYLKYSMTVDMLPADHHRYRYNQGIWEIRRGEISNEKFETSYTHPNSPWTGGKWMERAIAFSELKLNNHLETAKSSNHVGSAIICVVQHHVDIMCKLILLVQLYPMIGRYM